MKEKHMQLMINYLQKNRALLINSTREGDFVNLIIIKGQQWSYEKVYASGKQKKTSKSSASVEGQSNSPNTPSHALTKYHLDKPLCVSYFCSLLIGLA